MKYDDLVMLGFNINEAKTYMALLELGKSDASEIIKKTKFHKNIVYDNLQKLINKGLVTYVEKNKVREFNASEPEMLVELMKTKQEEATSNVKKAVYLSESIKKIKKLKQEKQSGEVFQGTNGIRAFYTEVLEGNNYCVLGGPKESISIMGEHFWLNFNAKMREKKLKARLLFNNSLRNYGKKIKQKHYQIKYLKKDFEPLTEILIQDNKVATIVWTKEPMLFLIRSKEASNSYRKYFSKMWIEAKE